MKVLKGISCAGGIAAGKAYRYRKIRPEIGRRTVIPAEIGVELEKLEEAIKQTRLQISAIKSQTLQNLGRDRADVFNAHIAILEDPDLIKELKDSIVFQKNSAEAAVEEVFHRHACIFKTMDDEYFRERAADIDDLGQRLLKNISGTAAEFNTGLSGRHIFVSEEITPTDIAMIIKESALGIVSGKGSNTSHAAIMARALGIPAVFGLGSKAISEIENYSSIIVDGFEGSVILSPEKEQMEHYMRMSERLNVIFTDDRVDAGLPSDTPDGFHIRLLANIDTPEDIDIVLKYGAEGVGLYRSEFLYSACEHLPCEEVQLEAYRTAAFKLTGKPLVIRTLDAGGDKRIPGLNLPEETNPFLGWRSIRVSLGRLDIFKTQLRAILRAGACGRLSLLYPMITCVSEVREANRILEQVRSQLESEGENFGRDIRVGLMVEVPSAAILIDSMLKEVDFVSIGTNDLCQYVLAADRSNPSVSHLHQPLHPAVLKLIGMVIEAAGKCGKPVSTCGEMASDPASVLVLMGLGMKEFSMNAARIPAVKKMIRATTMEYARDVARHITGLSTAAEAVEYAARALELCR